MEFECCVVTGGRGFVAKWLVRKLLQSGRWVVRIVDLESAITLDDEEQSSILGEALSSERAVYYGIDLRDKTELLKVFHGASVVFHMASPDSSLNDFKLHYDVTVQGTRNVINACLACKVKKLIYTSSPSVVFDGIHEIINGDESLPYPDKHNDIHSEMKAQAEAMVLKSNGREGLLTCALRPSAVFGPGDKLLVPLTVAAARAGKFKFILGNGDNMCDFTYVENVAHAHICAEQALDPGTSDAAGKAYFITNMEPIKLWEFLSLLLEGLGYQRPKISVPLDLVMPIAWVVEWTYKKLAPYGMAMPQFTPRRIRLLACTRTFNCSKAQNCIGYSPRVSLQEGMRLTIESFQHLRSQVPDVTSRSFDGPSKVYRWLGGGRVADVFLWRDDKQTFGIILALAVIFYFFFLSGYTFIRAAAELLLLIIVVLFIHGVLPSEVLGYSIEKIHPPAFRISEETVQHAFLSIRSTWNSGIAILKSISEGKDWILFLKIDVAVHVAWISFKNLSA
ncbi:hypothetical protein KI387_023184 [Taxus chinensis]|uniref:Reticulon-like protein n=1 Tax=Taxus chinensis TaxID=29808 RepID=A0AA38LBJ6_TAXCH|nr:hypothetical protein KI387_023184 [Taxus chinensis]